jgi:hypothetical protein
MLACLFEVFDHIIINVICTRVCLISTILLESKEEVGYKYIFSKWLYIPMIICFVHYQTLILATREWPSLEPSPIIKP